ADLARIDYLKREGSLPEGLEDTILAYGDEHFLNAAAFAIRGLTANPTGQEERARRALRNPSATAYYSACELAYLTGEEVDWPDY
ncbi:hypothetical protein, partial [Cognatiyoonia sp.]|uniref:hypothetical protein n=1 Tax=Cognatiyoonia sp. TaxID=2211652 RepID=UPI003F697322